MDFHGVLPIYTTDSFSSVPFGGNPAGACLDPTAQGLPQSMLQKVAAEMNISVTAFIRRVSEGDTFETANRFGLRWFTPTVEVVLCGHATLAAAATLFYQKENKSDVLYFETRSGTVSAKRAEHGITLDLPLDPPVPLEIVVAEDIVQDIQYGRHNKMMLIRLKDDALTRTEFENLPVPADRFQAAYTGDIVAVMLTMRGSQTNGCQNAHGETYDYVSRIFAPWAGVKEDPATGAVHGILGPYWSKVFGKDTFYARQCSKRGGEMRIKVREKDGRADVTGAVTFMLKGTMTV